MEGTQLDQLTLTKYSQSTYLPSWIEAFILAKKTEGASNKTLQFYREGLGKFAAYCETRVISQVDEISAIDLRFWLLDLETKGHNPGGVHAAFRCIRAFLRWYEGEAEPEGWHNPILKIQAPKLPMKLLSPVEISTVSQMVKTCNNSFSGLRDKALLLALLDSGCRANELLSIDQVDIDLITGQIIIQKGKGSKVRVVYIGKATRRAIRAYLKARNDNNHALWVTDEAERLTYSGLRQVVRRRAARLGIKTPSIHSFRCAFAINLLRAGTDVVSVSRLLGHSGLEMTRIYLKQNVDDLAEAHRRGSPVDNSGL
jgi:site-specific recombinase XerD